MGRDGEKDTYLAQCTLLFAVIEDTLQRTESKRIQILH